jgi:hypothetical protein
MADQDPLRIQILSVPGCPLVKKVQTILENCLSQTRINAIVEEVVGDYNSPTLLVNGFDVTGRPSEPGQISCRLDLPSEEEVLTAFRVLTVVKCVNMLEEQIQAAAFQSLLHTGQRVNVETLATLTNLDTGMIRDCVEKIHHTGHLKLDSDGFIVGAVGLSISPTKHEVSLDGRRFWTWCALDVIGIFGALNASGFVKSYDPSSNNVILVEFVKGTPKDTDVMVFIADLSPGISVCCDWCPRINFFTCKSSAEAWAQTNADGGSIVSVSNLAPVAREAWSRFTGAQIQA